MSEWISVKDRLPGGYVLVDPESGFSEPEEYIVHVKGADCATAGMFVGGEFIPLEPNAKFANVVDYWMPFPEPPEAPHED